jgi:hypothetical protein
MQNATLPRRPETGVLSPAPLMQLATGFYSFETFATAVELELFTRLAGGRRVTVAELAAELGFEHRPADLLLVACASLGLLVKDGDAYRNSPLAEEYLVVGRPAYFGGFVRFCEHREYLGWHRLIDALRDNRPVTWDPEKQDSDFSDVDPEMLSLFSSGRRCTPCPCPPPRAWRTPSTSPARTGRWTSVADRAPS